MTDTGKADYIAARASESLSYGDIAYAQGQGWCSSSPDGMGPHIPDGATCAECGAELPLIERTEVAYHADGYEAARPAINVKDYHAGMDYTVAVERVLAADGSDLFETTYAGPYEAAYDRIVSDFWQAAEEIATQKGLGEIEQQGRSGGWLVFTTLDPVLMYAETEADDPEDANADRAARDEWLAGYRSMVEWADAWIADAPRKVAALAQQYAMDEAGEEPARRFFAYDRPFGRADRWGWA